MGFSKQEQEIMDSLVDAHNKFIELPSDHIDEVKEWIASLHRLQSILGFRILRRDYPKIFNKR